ncbi:MAG: phage terminase large subunit [Novosphingobium sp.]
MLTLNDPQADFLDLPHKYRALVTGYGGGKTWVGCVSLCRHGLEFPRVNAGYFAPTYPQIRDIFYPTIEEVAHEMGMQAIVRSSNKEVHLKRGGRVRSTIICRSMDNPSSIIGFKIGQALVDELDVMAANKARDAWRKIIARMRYKIDGLRNGIDVTTTPEGFKFVYEQWVKAIRDKPSLASMYGMVQASTYDNEANLPYDYIDSLRESYPPQLIEAYLRGQFVNLNSGSVYPNFDRKENHISEVEREGEPLHVGMDFNVLNMTATVNVIRDDLPITVGELTKVRDTPAMARLLKERFKDKGHAVTIYPDASGQNTSSKNASESDLSILKQAGFTVRVDSRNPAVRDRVNAMNAMLLNDKAERRWKINTDRCPTLTEALEQQAYDKNGEPDKATGHDHPVDAQGYFIVHRYPITRRTAGIRQITGLA